MRERKGNRILATVGTLVLLALYSLPLYWLFSTSLKTLDQVFDSSAALIFRPTFQAYIDVWSGGFPASALNSLIIATLTTFLVVVTAVPTAYALARLNGWVVNGGLSVLIVLQMVPGTSTLIPIYKLLAELGLTGTFLGVALASAIGALPFSVLLLRPFFTAVPIAVEEAAAIDGAGLFRRFIQVVLPIARNGIATVATLAFIGAWGEFILAITILADPSQYPVSALLAQQQTSLGVNWPGLMAVSVLVSLPTVFIFLFGQRLLVGGISMGSVK